MRLRYSARIAALVVVAAAAMAWPTWTVRAQSVAKRPLTYDVYESWKTIGGTRLSDDGQWFAYATSSLAEDGELIVRNLKSGQEFRQPRGSAPQMTPDSKFVIFTILPPKAEADANANAAGGGATEPAAAPAPPAG